MAVMYQIAKNSQTNKQASKQKQDTGSRRNDGMETTEKVGSREPYQEFIVAVPINIIVEYKHSVSMEILA
jgi:hypothetical protein